MTLTKAEAAKIDRYNQILKEIQDRAPSVLRILGGSSSGYTKDEIAGFFRAFDLLVDTQKRQSLNRDDAKHWPAWTDRFRVR